MNRAVWSRTAVGLLLLGAIVLAYGNTFRVPFLFDDRVNILDNRSILTLWPPWGAFLAPQDTGIVGRPVINFSLALNYAVSGMQVWSYHLVNLLIHLLAVLTLFIVLRLMLQRGGPGGDESDRDLALATVCAWLWGMHPLQTQAVTYIIQRCESLMALCLLVAFACALAGWRTGQRRWHLGAALAFWLAMGCKESAAVAPLILLAYEWVFRELSPLRALRNSPWLYGGLWAGALAGIFFALSAGTLASRTEQGQMGLAIYWLTQCRVLIHYLSLAVWPRGLTLDYGWPAASFSEAWPAMAAVLAIGLLSLWNLWKRRPAGFLGMTFLLLLAPTSLIPLADPAFEHRMYLPLAPLIVWGALMVRCLLRRLTLSRAWRFSPGWIGTGGALILVLILGGAWGTLTFLRNAEYRTAVGIWEDTLRKRPGNFRGYQGLAMAFSQEGRQAEALELLLKAGRINPRSAYVQNDTGFVLFLLGRPVEAIPFFQEAIRLKPPYAKAHNNLGAALARTGRFAEAIEQFSQALELNADYPAARENRQKAQAEWMRLRRQEGDKVAR